MRSAYWQLLWKEMQQAATTALVFTLLIVAWFAFLFTRVGVWPGMFPFALGMMVLGFVPFWALWRTFFSFRQEWNGDHMYLLLSLPVPGWYITSTKLVVALVELFVYSAIIITGGVLLLSLDQPAALEAPLKVLRETALFQTGAKLALVQTVGLLIAMIIIQFSYLVGRIANRRKGLMTLVVGIVSSWLVFRLGGLVAPLLKWIPEVAVQSINIINDVVHIETAYIGVAPVIGSLVSALGLFVIGSTILERDVEL